MYRQLTGNELSLDLDTEERCEAITRAMKGRNLLVCLDDAWYDPFSHAPCRCAHTKGLRAVTSRLASAQGRKPPGYVPVSGSEHQVARAHLVAGDDRAPKPIPVPIKLSNAPNTIASLRCVASSPVAKSSTWCGRSRSNRHGARAREMPCVARQGLPSEYDAIRIMMSAAGIPHSETGGARVPSGAKEIAVMCKRLPLTLGALCAAM